MAKNKNDNSLNMFFHRRHFNVICHVLTVLGQGEQDNIWAEYARKLKIKFFTWGRTFTNKNGDDIVNVKLYETEQAKLIKLLTVYAGQFRDVDDYYFEVGKYATADKNSDKQCDGIVK